MYMIFTRHFVAIRDSSPVTPAFAGGDLAPCVGCDGVPTFAGGSGASCITISGSLDFSRDGVGAVQILFLSSPVRSQNAVMLYLQPFPCCKHQLQSFV